MYFNQIILSINNYFIINILKGNYLTNKLKIQMIILQNFKHNLLKNLRSN